MVGFVSYFKFIIKLFYQILYTDMILTEILHLNDHMK